LYLSYLVTKLSQWGIFLFLHGRDGVAVPDHKKGNAYSFIPELLAVPIYNAGLKASIVDRYGKQFGYEAV